MRAGVSAHVDARDRRIRESECGARDSARRTGEGEDASVVIDVAGVVEETHALVALDGPGDLADDSRSPSFADVRNAFDDSHPPLTLMGGAHSYRWGGAAMFRAQQRRRDPSGPPARQARRPNAASPRWLDARRC